MELLIPWIVAIVPVPRWVVSPFEVFKLTELPFIVLENVLAPPIVCVPVVLTTVLSTCSVPVEVIVPPVIPFVVAIDVTPWPSFVALIVIVSPDLTVVTLVPAAIVNVSLLLLAVAVPPELAVKFLYIACDDPLSVFVNVALELPDWFAVIEPDPDNPLLPVTVNVPLPTDGKDEEVMYPAPLVSWLLFVRSLLIVTVRPPACVPVEVLILVPPIKSTLVSDVTLSTLPVFACTLHLL